MLASPKSPVAAKRSKVAYPLHQCALYRVNSKKRLVRILNVDLRDLVRLSRDDGNFQVFELPEETCEFTGKTKKARWVQNPVPELKAVLSRIADLLARVDAPAYSHGATRGRSYRSNAAAHVGASSVATFDLKDFFPSTSSRQLFDFFKNELLCAPDVAGLLTDLCTHKGMLPTGSPASPVLACWANRRLFETLSHRGALLGLNLSVYVDDITFSGDAIPRSLTDQVEGIVTKYGHKLSRHKTKIFGPAQAKHVTGVVIAGGKLRVPHARFHKARAIRAALAAARDDERREKLAAKLCGLLGEAAFLDPAYKRWASDSVKVLAAIRAKFPKKEIRDKVRRRRDRFMATPVSPTSSS